MEFFVLGASFVQTELVGISLIKNKTKKEKKVKAKKNTSKAATHTHTHTCNTPNRKPESLGENHHGDN